MKELYHALSRFVKEDLNWKNYALTILFLATAIYINYFPAIEIGLFVPKNNFASRLGYYGMLFGGTYFLIAIISISSSQKNYLKDPRFWILGITFVFISTIPKLYILKLIDIRAQGWNLHEMIFASKCHFFVHQMLLSLAGLGIINLLLRKWVQFNYGFRWHWKTLKPYFLILILVAPLIIGASFLPDFQIAYPQYKPWKYANVFGLAIAQRSGIFELCYASGFVAVESIFRGALAITMFKIMGTRAILPMAALYCVFHFGKPMGEAISAFFGGYALGILAIHSRSILGGLIVHLGIAMLMETLAYLHHYY